MAVDLNQTRIDSDDEARLPLLKDLQGNILKGHGRDHSVHIFLKFKGDQAASRAWIRDFAKTYVVSAKKQSETAKRFRANPDDNKEMFGSFLLSAAAYGAIGIINPDQVPNDLGSAFRGGMKKANLRDPDIKKWEKRYQEDLHALIILANHDPALVAKAEKEVSESAAAAAEVVGTEHGKRLKNNHGNDIEQFGFVDGISQPLFTKYDIEKAEKRGIGQFDPTAPLSLVLVKDPNGTSNDSCGSFLVYRKLAQDVDGWDKEVFTLADKLGISPDLAGAYAMGRFQDGTPVTLSDEPLGEKNPANIFGYDDDMQGSRCPFHAHIRKTNPRGDTNRIFGEDLEKERSHRIARRGITYGERGKDKEVGLLFLCYQADIRNQFEFQQTAWSNEIQFVRQGTALDPTIGQGTQFPGGQQWPKRYGAAAAGFERFDFRRFVTLLGGEYFFAPSIGFLENL